MNTSPALRRCLTLLLTLLLVDWSAISTLAAPAPRGSTRAISSKANSKKSKVRGIPTYLDPTKDDVPEFDDPIVRQAAVAALGRFNGTVVAVDPNNGRILSVVNQRLAFSEGFQPCSTFKPVVGLAALDQGIITRDTMIPVARRRYLNLTEALAHSNNQFFEALGKQMGFETVSRYGKLFGLGEPAGHNIFEEHPGLFPTKAPTYGGVARMSSFGEGIHITPLQLASIGATLANGGTVYYLQYPRSDEERRNFTPLVKRKLEIGAYLPDVREGMLAAVLYGTGRHAFDPYGEQTLGKTGTCDDQGSRLGWFVSYSDPVKPRLVVAVLLRGHSRIINGPVAAEVAGRVFTRLRELNYFAQTAASSTAALPTPLR
ncbi:MAG TPA: penicillin-binding transpeptidase domain-containing protein [Candidatus Acidoferrales bacterium]|nr:penicillin-binding transpeptidase domain-containing protein [Candidatus Acidoferrales bacterium]